VHLLQGYLAHKKPHPPRIIKKGYVWGPTVVLEGGAVSYERGTTVGLMGSGRAPVADGDCYVESSLVNPDGVLRSGVRGQDSSAGMTPTPRQI